MKKACFAFLVFAISLASCAQNGASASQRDRTSPSSMEFNGSSFKILQLTDIHFSYSTNIKHEGEFLTHSVKYADPDLIVITGDSLLNASKGVVDSLFSIFDSWKIPFYFLFGNHELQGFYSESWLMNKIYASEYCWNSSMGSTSKSGHTDSVLNLQKDGKTIFQVYSLDTHSSTNINGVYYYDNLKQDQIDWYESEAKKAKDNNGGVNVPSLGFMHIPLWEIVDAYIENKGGIIGEIHEKATYKKVPALTKKLGSPLPFCPAGEYAPFFPKAEEYGMKGIFFGHDHSNDWVGEYHNIALGYGVKADRELYYSVSSEGKDMIGGALYTVKEDASYSIKHFYLDYHDYSLTYEKEVNRA